MWVEGVSAGPLGRTADALFEHLFRRGLVAELGRDVPFDGFDGTMELCRRLVEERGSDVSVAARRVLVNLFPDVNFAHCLHGLSFLVLTDARAAQWPPAAPDGRRGLLYWFQELFAKPFPNFSYKLNAWVTW